MFLGMAVCLPAAAVGRAMAGGLRRLQAVMEGNGDEDEALVPLLGRRSQGPRQGLLERPSPPGTPGSVASTTNSMLPPAAAAAAALWGSVAARGGGVRNGGGAGAGPGSSAAGQGARYKALALVLVPTAFDLVASILMAVGLLWISASTLQMVRGSEVVFSALLSTFFLRRRLNRWHKGGIAVVTAGVTLVGAASLLGGEAGGSPDVQALSESGAASASTFSTLLGMLLVVAAEVVQAAQVVVEDKFLHELDLAPLTVVGCEGVYGLVLMLAILPVVQVLPGTEGGGIHEDSVDTWLMLASSPAIRSACIWFTVGLALYNVAGMLVTDSLGAVTRTVLETLKTLLVWVLNLLAFYASSKRVGEPWTAHSWLQALGFAVLVGGTLVYARGEEVQGRKLRAKLRWARLRASLATLVSAEAQRLPLVPPRIAGPTHIRVAFTQPAAVGEAVERLEELMRQHRAAVAEVEAGGAETPTRPVAMPPRSGVHLQHALAPAASSAPAAAMVWQPGGGRPHDSFEFFPRPQSPEEP